MSYSLKHRFRIDAQGRAIAALPTHGMEAAARYYYARDHAEAERCCLELLERNRRHFDALHLLGVVCLDAERLSEAIEYLTRAVGERPADAKVHYHLGTAYLGLKDHGLAEISLRQALALQPDDIGTLNNLGSALTGQGRHEEAIECFRQVLATQPGHVLAHYNMGNSLAALDRPDAAVASYRAALANLSAATEVDRLADIQANLGRVLVDLGRYDDALASCWAMTAIRPGAAEWNESLVLLLLGRFAEGWRKYEGRWLVADHDPPRKDARVPALAEVQGKRILLTREQGHGDLIQFARYVPLLAERGAHVSIETYVELKALMQTLDGVATVIAMGQDEPPADIVTPLLSMPLVFGTDLDSIPAWVPYLSAPPDSLARWRQRLGSRKSPRIGLAWWGSQHIPKRSLSIERLLPVLSLSGLEFHALQKDVPAEQRVWFEANSTLIDHSTELNDFAETAALVALLDLVVTIDTSVAHLAGAMGKPVWIMLQHNADWRWLLDRTDSPWYPTARLFRQKRRGDWDSVVADVVQALRTREFG